MVRRGQRAGAAVVLLLSIALSEHLQEQVLDKKAAAINSGSAAEKLMGQAEMGLFTSSKARDAISRATAALSLKKNQENHREMLNNPSNLHHHGHHGHDSFGHIGGINTAMSLVQTGEKAQSH